MIKKNIGRHVKCLLLLSDFNETLFLSTDFRKTLNYQILGKIRPVIPELFHADGRTGRHDEANNRFFFFCDFENAPKNRAVHYIRKSDMRFNTKSNPSHNQSLYFRRDIYDK